MYSNMPQQGMYSNTMFPYPQIAPMSQPMNVPLARNVLSGRIVKNLDDITPADVAQNGSVSIFPQEDGNCIYTKIWDNDGTIKTQKFVPSEAQSFASDKKENNETNVVNSSDPSYQEIMDTLNDILDLLTQSSPSKKNRYQNNQNGSETNKDSKED